MKKLLVLSLLASFAQAHCDAETPVQEQQIPQTPSRMFREIYSYRYNRLNTAFFIEAALAIGCGATIYSDSWKDSNSFEYDAHQYPQCKEVLEFLKTFDSTQNNLHDKAMKLVNKVSDSQLYEPRQN